MLFQYELRSDETLAIQSYVPFQDEKQGTGVDTLASHQCQGSKFEKLQNIRN